MLENYVYVFANNEYLPIPAYYTNLPSFSRKRRNKRLKRRKATANWKKRQMELCRIMDDSMIKREADDMYIHKPNKKNIGSKKQKTQKRKTLKADKHIRKWEKCGNYNRKFSLITFTLTKS